MAEPTYRVSEYKALPDGFSVLPDDVAANEWHVVFKGWSCGTIRAVCLMGPMSPVTDRCQLQARTGELGENRPFYHFQDALDYLVISAQGVIGEETVDRILLALYRGGKIDMRFSPQRARITHVVSGEEEHFHPGFFNKLFTEDLLTFCHKEGYCLTVKALRRLKKPSHEETMTVTIVAGPVPKLKKKTGAKVRDLA